MNERPFLGVGHVTVPVRDLALAERFYVDLLGGEVLMRIDAAFLTRLGRPADAGAFHTSIGFGGETRLDLFAQPGGQPAADAGHPHIAIRVRPEALDALVQGLRDCGVPVDGPRRLGPPGHASAYFNDPFGNHLELETMGYAREIEVGPPQMASLVYAWSGRRPAAAGAA
jgi:catechol 2,3-dioxygenase-like lactoylglutathione lyase family enzyme